MSRAGELGLMVIWKGDMSCWGGLDAVELMWAGDMLWGESSGDEESASTGDWTAGPTTGETTAGYSNGMFQAMGCELGRLLGDDDIVAGGTVTGMADAGETAAAAGEAAGDVVKG